MRFIYVSLLPVSLLYRSTRANPAALSSMSGTGVSSSCKQNDVIGGGAINEKDRTITDTRPKENPIPTSTEASFDPSKHRSQLWHALEGMDRYPAYLSRWQEYDMEQLEQALEMKLLQVRNQKKSILERRQGIRTLMESLDPPYLLTVPQNWEDIKNHILDPRAAKAIFQSKWYRKGPPSVEDVLSGRSEVDLDPHLLEGWMDQELFDVYSMPLLSRDFCVKLLRSVQAVATLGETEQFHDLHVGKRPIDLDTIDLSWINNLLFHLVIRPISRHLYKDTETIDDLDWRQGYVAGYSANPTAQHATPRQRLVSHTDDSEVTMNVCIGEDFEGGALQFRGLRGTTDGVELMGHFQPIPGTALIHAGRHFHEVTEVTKGNRYTYIIWARSWKGARKQSCPCCWLNRRQVNSCICGWRWN